MKILLIVAWSFWGVGILGLLYFLVKVSTEKAQSPEAGPGLGIFLVLSVLFLYGIAGFVLRWASARHSMLGVVIITVLLGYVVIFSALTRSGRGMDDPSFLDYQARVGDFSDPKLRSLAAHIKANDPAGLQAELGGHPPPPGRDRAGHDLLSYVVLLVDRSEERYIELLRVILETGADPNASVMPDGVPLLSYVARKPAAVRLLLAHHANPNPANFDTVGPPLARAGSSLESVRALVEAGADINAIAGNIPAVVRFTGDRNWDSAIYLVEKGARLDTVGPDGASIDFYLNTWKDDIYTAPIPEGWSRLRAAIAKQRNSP